MHCLLVQGPSLWQNQFLSLSVSSAPSHSPTNPRLGSQAGLETGTHDLPASPFWVWNYRYMLPYILVSMLLVGISSLNYSCAFIHIIRQNYISEIQLCYKNSQFLRSLSFPAFYSWPFSLILATNGFRPYEQNAKSILRCFPSVIINFHPSLRPPTGRRHFEVIQRDGACKGLTEAENRVKENRGRVSAGLATVGWHCVAQDLNSSEL